MLRRPDPAAVGAFAVGVLPAAVASANGGYFATSWGWAALAFGWVAAIGLVLSSHPRGPVLAMVGCLLALDLWTFASAAWSPVPSSSAAAGEQVLALALGVLAFAVVVRRHLLTAAALGLVTGATLVCAYALLTRLVPGHLLGGDAVAGNRLYTPVGYWNGLGIYGAVALLVALGLLTRVHAVTRALVGLALPVVATTVYFTFSRGAALAFAFGLAVTFALDPARVAWLVRTVLVAIPATVAVLLASGSDALTTEGATAHAVTTQGHELALWVGLLALASAALGALSLPPVPRRAARAVTALVTAAGVLAVAAGLVAVGGPSGIWDKFKAPPPQTNGHLNKRLFSFSGSARTPLWAAAVDEVRDHPVLGGGAGSYEPYYLARRDQPSKVRNAHNLYLETLAELGPLGLALLVGALLPALVVAVRARREPLVPALAAAYAAALLHMAVDWDWQLTGVAVTALACGAGVLIAAEPEFAPRRVTRRALAAVATAGIVAAFVVLVGNLYAGRAASAADGARWAESAKDAKRARTWAPWSSEPWRLLGEAQLSRGDTAAATKSFRTAIDRNRDDWSLWFDLARASQGKAQRAALARAARLNPLAPEIAELRRELAAEGTIEITGF